MKISELKSNAREQLRGNWGIAIITVLVYAVILNLELTLKTKDIVDTGSLSINYNFNFFNLILGGVLSVGLCKFLLNMATKRKEPTFGDLFSNFNIYLKTLGLHLLITLAVAVGLILLIVPGIIVALMFSQSYYILCEDNSKSITKCIGESVQMMKGHKMDLFLLELSFIGWWILVAITFGIAGLWVMPYVKMTEANFYLSITK